MKFPEEGTPRERVLEQMEALRRADVDWRGGKTFGYVYNAGEEVLRLADEAAKLFLHTNALSLSAFPSLRRFEAETLAMCIDLLHGGDQAAGSLTSGGTESICMAVKTARDHARRERPEVTRPEMVLPVTIHPAFQKAGHYFDVKVVTVPVGADLRVPAEAVREAITDQTILIAGSAPCFPFGVIDPIEELAGLASSRGIWMHVDACLGGLMLPFIERALGEAVPGWDFRVAGVSSISADLHKYGFSPKGASLVLYRSRELRRDQFFAYADWPGGLYASPTLAGSRSGAPIAASWAILKALGVAGFGELTRVTIQTARNLMAGIEAIGPFRILGKPPASVFAFTSDAIDVYLLGDALEAAGWRLDRQQRPASLHMMVSPAHAAVADRFLSDLRRLTAELSGQPPAAEGMAAMYGMAAVLPDRGAITNVLLDFLDGFDSL
jgi:glutamate/tyrosine decarboxylase-like PLP-dependent enzyme